MATMPPLDAYRRNWLAQAEYSAPLDPSDDRCGLSFFFYDAVEWEAFCRVAGLSPDAVADSDDLYARYDLVPRRWVKLHFERGERRGMSSYFVLNPANRYPITSLRLASRRYGHDPSRLEAALRPALEQDDAIWAVIVKRPATTFRISCHLERARLSGLIQALVDQGYLEPSLAPMLRETDARTQAGSSVYVTIQPGDRGAIALDYEQGKGYLKWRPTSQTCYRPLPEVLSAGQLDALCAVPVAEAAAYYDDRCDLILRDVGTTYQAALLPGDPARTTLEMAREADVQPGMRVLDAGCGAAGPAVAIASAFAGVRVDAITVSERQWQAAEREVLAAGLGDRVFVAHGDYHALPYPDECFDRVLFLESFGYARDPAVVVDEIRRVLKPGGRLLIKDAFRAAALSPAERLELAEFERVYAFHTPLLEATRALLAEEGLSDVSAETLGSEYDLERFYGAMGVTAASRPIELTEFGRLHYRRFERLPVHFHLLRATKG